MQKWLSYIKLQQKPVEADIKRLEIIKLSKNEDIEKGGKWKEKKAETATKTAEEE